MIGQVSGILIDKQLPWVVIETQGLGYDIQVPMTTGLELPALGQSVILFTQFIVREDAQLLYGFHTKSLREIFRQVAFLGVLLEVRFKLFYRYCL